MFRDDWRKIARYAWSVRLMLLSAVLGGAEVVVQVIIAFSIHVPIHSGLFAALAGLTSIAATIARFVTQKEFGSD